MHVYGSNCHTHHDVTSWPYMLMFYLTDYQSVKKEYCDIIIRIINSIINKDNNFNTQTYPFCINGKHKMISLMQNLFGIIHDIAKFANYLSLFSLVKKSLYKIIMNVNYRSIYSNQSVNTYIIHIYIIYIYNYLIF